MRRVSLIAIPCLVLGFLTALPLAAADSTASQAPVYHIEQMNPSTPAQKLAGPGVQVHLYSDEKGGWKLPTVADRENAFYRAGLRPEIESWDQLDRDMLYLRARKMSVAELSQQYPKLSRSKLKSLHRLLSRKIARKAGK